MSNTRAEIIQLGESLIRHRGFNAFSYYDISRTLNIKPAAIHYHFPKKTDLGIAVLEYYGSAFDQLIKEVEDKPAPFRLIAFLNIFWKPHQEGTTCIIGALSPDLHTFQVPMQGVLKSQIEKILEWLTYTLDDGKKLGELSFKEAPRTKALLIITNMLASLSITRVTGKTDFDTIKKAVLQSTIA